MFENRDFDLLAPPFSIHIYRYREVGCHVFHSQTILVEECTNNALPDPLLGRILDFMPGYIIRGSVFGHEGFFAPRVLGFWVF